MSRVGALIAPFLAVDMASRSAAAAHGAEGIIAGCCLAAAVATAALPMETSGRQLTVRDDESTQLLIGMVCLKCHARARLALAMPRCRLPCRAAPVARGLLGTSRPVAVCTTQRFTLLCLDSAISPVVFRAAPIACRAGVGRGRRGGKAPEAGRQARRAARCGRRRQRAPSWHTR